jgi:hypothetical protein
MGQKKNNNKKTPEQDIDQCFRDFAKKFKWILPEYPFRNNIEKADYKIGIPKKRFEDDKDLRETFEALKDEYGEIRKNLSEDEIEITHKMIERSLDAMEALDELRKEFGEHREPLSEEELNVIHSAVGSIYVSKIKAFLQRQLPDQDFSDLKWQRLINLCSDSVKRIPTLTTDEVEVLDYLNDQYPTIKYQEDITDSCKDIRSRKTMKGILDRLITYQLISRPEGRSTGYVIADKGKDYHREYYS